MSRRRLTRLSALVGSLLILFALGIWLWLRAGLPRREGTETGPGLGAPVRVVRDGAGVAHIHATTDADACFALGYVHAQDRLWQMEFQRRVGAGRLSEILGESTLETDRYLRTVGLHRAAAAAYEALDGESRALLDAYAAGVNAFLATDPALPPEFRLLRLRPEPWRPQDSLAWMKMMSLDLAGDQELELIRSRLLGLLGPERTAQLLPDYVAGARPSLPPPELAPGLTGASDRVDDPTVDPTSAAGLLALHRRLAGRLDWLLPGAASNSWVVSGRLTASGRPFLANDPHLSGRIPSIWYLAALHGDRIHAVGASLPGLPGIVIGRNERIAWGLTSFYADTQDLVPVAPTATGLRRVDEPIAVKGRDRAEPWTVRLSAAGPLVSDVLEGANQPLALRWTALDPDDSSFAALIAIDRAGSRADFLAALAGFVTPPQVFAYADFDGHIGMIGAGRIPIRRPAAATDGADPWQGFIPFAELPQAWDPPAGWLANANQVLVAPQAYPHHLSDQWAPPYRMARIAERLEELGAAGGIDQAAMRALQLDQVSPQIARFAGLARAAVGDRPDAGRHLPAMLATMADGRMDRERPEAALLEAWFLAFSEALLADELPADLRDEVLRRRHPWLVEQALAGEDWGPDAPAAAAWCDDVRTPLAESCPDLLWQSLPAALAQLGLPEPSPEVDGPALDALLGRLPAWGERHRTQFPHSPFSEVPLLRPLFHRQIASGGDGYAVNVANVDVATLQQRNLPSYRQLIDLGRPQEAVFQQSTGQSGHPLDPHYDDFILPHRDGGYLPMRLDREPPAGGNLLVLQPAITVAPPALP